METKINNYLNEQEEQDFIYCPHDEHYNENFWSHQIETYMEEQYNLHLENQSEYYSSQILW